MAKIGVFHAALNGALYFTIHSIVTEESMPVNKAKNLKMLRGFAKYCEGTEMRLMCRCFKEEIEIQWLVNMTHTMDLVNISQRFDETNGLQPGTSLGMFFYLVWRRVISIDLNDRINNRKIKVLGIRGLDND